MTTVFIFVYMFLLALGLVLSNLELHRFKSAMKEILSEINERLEAIENKKES